MTDLLSEPKSIFNPLTINSGEDEMKIIASTQNPTLTQLTVAGVLGLTANKVVVTVKRMGGGFGGKESRSVSCLLN